MDDMKLAIEPVGDDAHSCDWCGAAQEAEQIAAFIMSGEARLATICDGCMRQDQASMRRIMREALHRDLTLPTAQSGQRPAELH